MKILYVAPRVPSFPLDGGSSSTFYQVRELKAAGHTIWFVALNTSRHRATSQDILPFVDRYDAVDIDTSISLTGALKALTSTPEPLYSSLGRAPYTMRRFQSAEMARMLARRIGDEMPHVVHADYLPTVWPVVAAKHIMGEGAFPPVLYRAHNVEFRIIKQLAGDASAPLHHRLYRRFLARQTELYERKVAQVVDGVATVSDVDTDWFLHNTDARIVRTIVPGVDIPAMVRRPDPPSKRLGLVSSLEWPPNVEGILWFVRTVAPLIWEADPAIQVHIAGRAPVDEILKLHDGNRVIVHGPVADAGEFLATLDVAIIPILSGSGVRIKLLENMAHGIPVVSTSAGAEGVPVESGKHVLIANTARAFADACVRCINDDTMGRAMANAAREMAVDSYSWGSATQKLLDIYSEIIAAKNSNR